MFSLSSVVSRHMWWVNIPYNINYFELWLSNLTKIFSPFLVYVSNIYLDTFLFFCFDFPHAQFPPRLV